MNIPPLLRKKWFWIGFGLLILFSIIFDLAAASFILVKSLTSGKWDHTLLWLGMLYAGISAYKQFLPLHVRREYQNVTKLLFFVCFIWAWVVYGFFSSLYFIVTIFILARFLGWLLKILKKVLHNQ